MNLKRSPFGIDNILLVGKCGSVVPMILAEVGAVLGSRLGQIKALLDILCLGLRFLPKAVSWFSPSNNPSKTGSNSEKKLN